MNQQPKKVTQVDEQLELCAKVCDEATEAVNILHEKLCTVLTVVPPASSSKSPENIAPLEQLVSVANKIRSHRLQINNIVVILNGIISRLEC